jgi:asparagine synthase (glutamine-hydrolysing)
MPEKKMADRYRELLFEAVRKRLRCAPRRAFTLSGGMDSSSVLSAAVSLEGSKQVATSTVYDDATYDESEDIRTILDETVSNWIRVDVSKPDVHDLIGKMVQINDEPIATATWLSHFQLCGELGASGFPAVFTGLGGDELNAGEYEHFFFFFADLQAAGEKDLLDEEIRGWVRHHDHPIFKKNAEVAARMVLRVADLDTPGRCLPDRERIGKYSSVLAPGFFDLGSFDPEMDRVFPSYLKNRTYQDIFRETAPCCLRAQDRHGFAFGVAHLNPFYDRRLVEFLFQVPGTAKIRSGVTKHLLREAMRGVLPEQTRTRIKKTGWNAPAHVWFSGSEADRLLDELKAGKLGKEGKLNLPEIERLVREHREIVSSGHMRENHMMLLWQLANLNAWIGR